MSELKVKLKSKAEVYSLIARSSAQLITDEFIKALCYNDLSSELKKDSSLCKVCNSYDNVKHSSVCETDLKIIFVFMHCKKCDAGWNVPFCKPCDTIGTKWKFKY